MRQGAAVQDQAEARNLAAVARIARPAPRVPEAEAIPPSFAAYGTETVPGSVTFVLPAVGAGGSEHVVSMLCNHFARKGSAVRLACFDPPGTVPFYPLDPRISLICLDVPSRLRGRISGWVAMLKRYGLLKAELCVARPDIIIAFLTRTNVLAALAGHVLGIPVLVSERNNPQRQSPGAGWNWLRQRAYRHADALVTMTHGAARYFRPSPTRIDRVIPNHAAPPPRQVIPNVAGTRLVAVGRLVEQKGFDLLLQAFARVAADFPEWRLTIWGEGPERNRLEALRHELRLDDRVDMPGITEKPGDWIAHADLFVLSSRFEGWGLVVGEAMAAGIPVVSFACPWGPDEMIDNGRSGLLAPDQDVDALAAALAQAMADPALRARLGQAGREAMERHAPDRILAQWDALIGTLLLAREPMRSRAGR